MDTATLFLSETKRKEGQLWHSLLRAEDMGSTEES